MTISSIIEAFENQYVRTQYLKMVSPMMKAKVITLLLEEIGKTTNDTEIVRVSKEILALLEKKVSPIPIYTNQTQTGELLLTEYESPKALYYAIRSEYGKNWLPRRGVYAVVDHTETFHLLLTSNPYSSVANMVYRLSKHHLFYKRILKLEWNASQEESVIQLNMRNIRMFYITKLLVLGFRVSDYGLTFKYNKDFVTKMCTTFPQDFIRLRGILSKSSE